MINQSIRSEESATKTPYLKKSANENKSFAHDVEEGLSSMPKRLPSKYFYDETGDSIFQAIMHMPEYYLTRSEYEILDRYKESFHALFSPGGKPFKLIEFGAGDGLKTKILLKHFAAKKTSFRYIPIDISGNVLQLLVNDLKQNLPTVKVEPLQDDYFLALRRLSKSSEGRNVVLFLGSNIGNFAEEEAIGFLQAMGSNLNKGDLALIGFDLKKDPKIILKAYDDAAGHTRAFNFNLLSRINRELGGNFELEQFEHCPSYDPLSGEARSYLVSRKEQQVYIGSLKQSFHFRAWEPIHVEISRKYDLTTIKRYAAKAGFKVKELFYDAKQYYVNALWEKE
jgi:L-histidine N-alpha-methyltransferase